MLYEMLTGQVPFRADNLPAVIQLHLTQDPEPPSTLNMAIPRHVENVVLRCMKKDPAARYQNVTDLLKDLRAEEITSSGLTPDELLLMCTLIVDVQIDSLKRHDNTPSIFSIKSEVRKKWPTEWTDRQEEFFQQLEKEYIIASLKENIKDFFRSPISFLSSFFDD